MGFLDKQMFCFDVESWQWQETVSTEWHWQNTLQKQAFWYFLGDPKYNEGGAAIEVFNLCNDNEWLAWYVVFPTASDTQVEKRGT